MTPYERAADFEQLITDTLDVLAAPAVVEALGASALGFGVVQDVSTVLESAFLPDMNNGYASTPKQYEHANNIAILPLTRREARRGVVMDPSMFQLSPRHLDGLDQALQRQHPETDEVSRAGLVRTLGTEALEWTRTHAQPIVLDAAAKTIVVNPFARGLAVATRPVILINSRPTVWYAAPHVRRLRRAEVLVHEVIHANDRETLAPDGTESEDIINAYLESRAYLSSERILAATGIAALAPRASKVEQMRRRHGYAVDPARPFEVPPGLIEEYKAAGVIR